MSQDKVNSQRLSEVAQSVRKLRFGLAVCMVAVGLLSLYIATDLVIENTSSVERRGEPVPLEVVAALNPVVKAVLNPDILGVLISDPLSDVIFKLGSPSSCARKRNQRDDELGLFGRQVIEFYDIQNGLVSHEEVNSCRWIVGQSDQLDEFFTVLMEVSFVEGVASHIVVSTPKNVPFDSVEEMIALLQEPDIVATSNYLLTRMYTYLPWGISFTFNSNKLRSSTLGAVEWRSFGKDTAEYLVKGVPVCPGEKCPWDEDGLKPEYENASYRDFLPD